tara:strand:+ start:1282 stop:2313 length:1032 start_codon:yes stop_codon:yes gene_type:complete
MKKISILHTGGTLASKVDYKTGAASWQYTDKDMLKLYPELKKISKISSKLITNMASEDMDFKFYNKLAKEIEKEIKKKKQGIIITHGTDTLHYTAAALSFILENLSVPVILVGAQRSSDRGGSDATLNLLCAAQFISKTEFSGIAICMHETVNDTTCSILPATKSRKLHTSRRDAFKVINDNPIALVHKHGAITLSKKLDKKTKDKLQLKLLNEKLKIGILKTHPNIAIEEIKQYSKFNGLVIEGTGMGHVPDKIIPELKKLKIPIVMSSQCIFGRINMNVYSPGRKLIEAGILGNQSDMTTETTFIKLAWLLSNFKKKEIQELLNINLRGELNERTPTNFLE